MRGDLRLPRRPAELLIARRPADLTAEPEPRAPRRPADLLTAAMSRALRLGPARNPLRIDRDLPVPMRDGTILLADHYAPVGGDPGRPVVLIRGPYGRGPQFAIEAWGLAERGYHVLLQSCRGTYGSGGTFIPAVNEAADGQDTVAWLREQPWYTGKLALVGQSYLAFTAWAVAASPPPELTAMALFISPHDLADAGFGHGPFELFNLLSWSDLMASQERLSAVRTGVRTLTAQRRLADRMSRLPVSATGTELAGGAGWYCDWFDHPDRADHYWDDFSAAAALERVSVPTLLVTGVHDFFVDQTVRQYQELRRRGVPAALTLGPWSHMTLDLGAAMRQAVAWLDAYGGGDAAAVSPRRAPARVWTSGPGRWRDLPDWPPPGGTAPLAWYLTAGGSLAVRPAAQNAPASAGLTAFRYDPADPTPSVGGRLMSVRGSGSQDNTALEARPDVLTFSTGPLDSAVEVMGVPVAELHLDSDSPYCDVFVRLCDVDERGRSRNLTDQIVRCTPESVTPGEVRTLTVPLTDISHVFAPGHRIRLQVSGGAHPRFARNLGTDDDLLHGTRTAPVRHQVRHSARYPSALFLPVLDAAGARELAAAVAQDQGEDHVAAAEEAAGAELAAAAGLAQPALARMQRPRSARKPWTSPEWSAISSRWLGALARQRAEVGPE